MQPCSAWIERDRCTIESHILQPFDRDMFRRVILSTCSFLSALQYSERLKSSTVVSENQSNHSDHEKPTFDSSRLQYQCIGRVKTCIWWGSDLHKVHEFRLPESCVRAGIGASQITVQNTRVSTEPTWIKGLVVSLHMRSRQESHESWRCELFSLSLSWKGEIGPYHTF